PARVVEPGALKTVGRADGELAVGGAPGGRVGFVRPDAGAEAVRLRVDVRGRRGETAELLAPPAVADRVLGRPAQPPGRPGPHAAGLGERDAEAERTPVVPGRVAPTEDADRRRVAAFADVVDLIEVVVELQRPVLRRHKPADRAVRQQVVEGSPVL